MVAILKSLETTHVVMEIYEDNRSKGTYNVPYKNVRMTNLKIGQMFDVVKDCEQQLNFWLK